MYEFFYIKFSNVQLFVHHSVYRPTYCILPSVPSGVWSATPTEIFQNSCCVKGYNSENNKGKCTVKY